MGYPSRFLIALLVILFTANSLCLIDGQPGDHFLVYELPRAYPNSEWVDSKALYMKEDEDSIYFYVEFYGSMPSTIWDWRRQVTILIDSDKDPKTGERYEEIGADYVIHAFIVGDKSVLLSNLLKWNETIGDFQIFKDLKSMSIIDPGLNYVEIKVDKNDIGYTPRGFDFYVLTTGEWGHSGIKPWLDEF